MFFASGLWFEPCCLPGFFSRRYFHWLGLANLESGNKRRTVVIFSLSKGEPNPMEFTDVIDPTTTYDSRNLRTTLAVDTCTVTALTASVLQAKIRRDQ